MRDVDKRSDIREFLATRRAKITPEQVGLPAGGGRRRVPGLRREEVAVLAGVSTDWYTRLEKGHISGVSDEVLDAVAQALRLDEAERDHLYDLARAARPPPGPRVAIPAWRASQRAADPRRDGHRTGVGPQRPSGHAGDQPARPGALLAGLRGPGPAGEPGPVQLPRPALAEFYPDWDDTANTSVALLRTEAGRDPYDRDLTDLVGELATRSEEFRTRWAAHDVRLHRTGTKRFHHPVVGDLELAFDAIDLPADPGLTLTAYTAEPGSPTEDALTLLASWAATDQRDQAVTDEGTVD